MSPATASTGLGSSAKTAAATKHKQRVIPAIPLQYPRVKKTEVKVAVEENSATAKSEKFDASTADDDQSTQGSVQYPMTPESISSSSHKDEENGHLGAEREGSADSVEGSQDHGVSAEDHLTTTSGPEVSHESESTKGTGKTNGQSYHGGESGRNGSVSMPKSKPFTARKIPQELPPPFYPSTSAPTSNSSTATQHPQPQPYPPHTNGLVTFGLPAHSFQRTSHPLTFNPEANFQPLDRRGVDMSRTPSHASSHDRPINESELQSPMLPHTPSTFHEPKMASAFNLQEFMLEQFDHSAFADSLIDLTPFSESSKPLQIRAHVFILSRSPNLRQMAINLDPQDRIFHLKRTNKFITEFGLVQAIRYLYGAPLLTPNDFIHDLSQATFLDISANAPATRAMTQALGYVAAGCYLELPAVVAAGLECARHIQRWDTIPTALSFALDGGLTQWWRNLAHQEGVEQTAPDQEPTFGEAGSQLLQDTLVYIALNFPLGFQLMTTATQLRELPRLPTVIESRPSTSDPRLSLIQFGQLAMEDTGRPDFLTTFISSILLSLPFPALKFLFEHPLFNPKVSSFEVVHAVIQEREDRRFKVLNAKRVKKQDATLWEETRWSEKVVTPSPVFPGFQLHRTLVENGTNGKHPGS